MAATRARSRLFKRMFVFIDEWPPRRMICVCVRMCVFVCVFGHGCDMNLKRCDANAFSFVEAAADAAAAAAALQRKFIRCSA